MSSNFPEVSIVTVARENTLPRNWGLNAEFIDTHKAPMLDGIYLVVIKASLKVMLRPVVDLLRGCIVVGLIRVKWWRVRAVFIPKLWRRKYTAVKVYRPAENTE